MYSISPKKVKVCAVRYGYGTVLVRSWCGLGALMVRSWYALGTLLVRSWCAHGSLESSIDESVRYSTRFRLLAVGKRTRMHGKHGQYVDVKTYFLVQLLLDRQ